MTKTETHAIFSPSAAKRWLACPASVRLGGEAGALFYSAASTYAVAGTAAMAVLEETIKAEGTLTPTEAAKVLWARAEQMPPDKREALREGLMLIDNDDSRAALRMAAGRLLEIARTAQAWGVETRVDIAPEHGIWGTCDFWALSDDGKMLTIVDYKHGAGYLVSAESNPQLMLYAAGFLRGRNDVERVRLAICQPRHPEAGADGWDEVEEDASVIRFFLSRVLQKIREVDTAKPETGEHCKYCPALLVCPARRAEVRRMIKMAERGMDQAAVEDLAEAIRLESRVSDFFMAAKRKAVDLIDLGIDVPGVTVRTRQGNLVWKQDDAETIAALREALPGCKVAVTTPLTPRQMLDRYPDAGDIVSRLAERRPPSRYAAPAKQD